MIPLLLLLLATDAGLVVPSDGATNVVRNPLLIVAIGQSLPILVDATTGTDLGAQVDFVPQRADLVRITPVRELRAGGTFSVVVPGGTSPDVVLGTFTTGNTVDSVAPETPEVTVLGEVSLENRQVRLTLASNEPLFLASVADPAVGPSFNTLIEPDGSFAYNTPSETVSVVALDQGGNSTEPVDVDLSAVPEGCAATPAPPAGLLVVVLGLLRARKKKKEEEQQQP